MAASNAANLQAVRSVGSAAHGIETTNLLNLAAVHIDCRYVAGWQQPCGRDRGTIYD